MKKRILVTLLLVVGISNASVDWDIYSDDTIESGVYDTVNIYDTPPDQTTVDMTGGAIDYCNVYDTANLNFEGGNIFLVTSHNDSNVNINFNPSPDVFELYDNSKVYLHNGDDYTTVQIFGDAELHIYGYDFEYDPSVTGTNAVGGFWESGEEFTIALRSNHNPYTQVILHEIPEPLTFTLLIFGSLWLKKRHV